MMPVARLRPSGLTTRLSSWPGHALVVHRGRSISSKKHASFVGRSEAMKASSKALVLQLVAHIVQLVAEGVPPRNCPTAAR